MKSGYAIVTALLLWTWATAGTLTLNGVDYNTENLVENCLVVHFAAGQEPQETRYDKGNIITNMPAFDKLNASYDIESIEQLFPGSKKSSMPEMAGYYRVTFSKPIDFNEKVSAYRTLDMIDTVDPVPIHKVCYTPNDPSLTSQWGLTKIQAREAWDIGQGDADVILAIIDSGVDWNHPDLAGDIWMNPEETLDGSDNDFNGYIDDIRGWDWVTGVSGYPGEDNNTPDNDPMDFDGHGTHCSGIAAACTDNGIGVAGLGFNCKVMGLRIGWRHSDGYTYVRMDFAAQAFAYATDMGARVFNCSWGSSYANYFASAVTYALSNNVLIVAAAGNENNNVAGYLNSRSEVISVAATSSNDTKAGFSCYGNWVDVSAPGVNIYSTYYNNTYASLDGTSMAAPFVVGLAGLIIAEQPDITYQDVFTRIVDTADPIDELNPGYAGQLGSGRINAFAAMAAQVRPNFNISGSNVTITNDDGDGVLNPGESFDLTVTLDNTWADANNVIVTARSNDYFAANDSVSSFGNIAHNGSGNNNSEPFNLTARPDANPGTWDIDLEIEANGIYIQTLNVTVGFSMNQVGFPLTLSGNINSAPLVFDVDRDGNYEIVVGTNNDSLYILEANGSYCSGWPQYINGDLPGGVAVGDIDNDSNYEIVAASKTGNVCAWEADGSVMSGFPVSLGGTVYNGVVLIDIDGNLDLEIVVGNGSNDKIFVLEHTGVNFGWSPYTGSDGWYGAAVAIDLFRDGSEELVYAGMDDHIHAWGTSSDELSGFPVELSHPVYSSAAAGYIDAGISPQIVTVTSQGEVYLIDPNGNVASGFPVDLDATVTISPIVADIDGNSLPDIIVVDNARHIYAINSSGQLLQNFPINCDESIKSSPVAADLDGDNINDIIVGCQGGKICAYNYNGEMLNNFPIGGSNLGEVRSSPAVCDLDSDGDLEIVFGTYSSDSENLMVVDYKTHSTLNEMAWPNGGCDNHRSGFCKGEAVIGITDDNELPMVISLGQNYPNPFNASTTISYTLPKDGNVTVEMYDILGRKVSTLFDGYKQAGYHSAVWNANEQSSGLYFYRLTTDNYTETKRCLLIK